MIFVVNLLRFLGTCHSTHPSPSVPDVRSREIDFHRLRDLSDPSPRDAHSRTYIARGAAQHRNGDLVAALEDFERAIVLDPRSGAAHHLRGHVRVDLQDFEGAVLDFGKAWELDPGEPEAIYDRACAFYDLHSWERCLRDFAQSYEKIPSLRGYAQIRFCLARSRMGQRAAAERDLAQFLERRPDGDPWIAELLRFVAGLSNEELLFAEAGQDPRERLCQANFYAGTLRLLDGDEEQARMYFTTCLETRSTQYREFASAAAELRALDARK
jgi:lipoprotein NlpI